MSETIETIFHIKRFNPDISPKPYLQEFKLDPPKGTTILDCLNHIKWYLDGTLTYRMSCRSAICGSCAVKVNGKAKLACRTQVSSVIQEDKVITIEPLGNLPVVKDLVCEFRPFWEKIEKVAPWVVPDPSKPQPEKENLVSPEQFNMISDTSTCIMCASCYSDCTVLEIDGQFIGPAALAKAQRFVYDPRDASQKERLEFLSKPGGIWDCTRCMHCVEKCPKSVKPMERIVELRLEAMKRRIVDNNGSRHAIGFEKIIKESGWLDENKLAMTSTGSLSEKLQLLPVGFRMIAKGKMPSPIHKPLKSAKAIKKIAQKIEKNK